MLCCAHVAPPATAICQLDLTTLCFALPLSCATHLTPFDRTSSLHPQCLVASDHNCRSIWAQTQRPLEFLGGVVPLGLFPGATVVHYLSYKLAIPQDCGRMDQWQPHNAVCVDRWG